MKSVSIAARLMAIAVLLPAIAGAQGEQRQSAQQQNRRPVRVGELVIEMLQLTDQQRPRFAEITRRFGDREMALGEEERVARTSVRNLLCSGDTTRGQDLSRALDQVLDIQKRRHQLIEDQQKELSTVLTPYQRARFMGTREFIQDRLGPGRGGGRGRGLPGGPGGPPPDGPPMEGRGQRGQPPDICAGPPPGGRGGRRG